MNSFFSAIENAFDSASQIMPALGNNVNFILLFIGLASAFVWIVLLVKYRNRPMPAEAGSDLRRQENIT